MDFSILKAKWEQQASGPSVVRQVVFEWPEDQPQIPVDIIAKHPACRSGQRYGSSWWLSEPRLPQIHDGWAYWVESIIDPDPLDSPDAETYRQIIRDLERKTCEALNDDDGLPWLTAEIVRRLSPRQMWRLLRPSKYGGMLNQWSPGDGSRWAKLFYRSSIIDNLASDAALVLGQIHNKQGAFVPTDFQRRILDALEGHALKKQQLADKVAGGDGRRLYRPGGLTELRTAGLVEHKHGLGYYRPAAAPN